METKLPPDFKEFLRLLNAKRVEYLLIGGYAVGYYGYPRATNDIDIWVGMHPENASKVVEALRAFGFNTPNLSEELFLKKDSIVRMGNPPMRLEIMTSLSGVDFGECYAERVVDTVDGMTINLISLGRLKENKKASGRLKDLNDLEHLS